MMPVFYFITVSKNLEKWHLALWRVLDIYKCGASRRNQAPALALTNSMKKGKRKAPTERCSRLERLANHRFTRARAFFRLNPFLSFEFFVQVRSLRCAFSCDVAYPHFCISIKTTPILPTDTNRLFVLLRYFLKKVGECRRESASSSLYNASRKKILNCFDNCCKVLATTSINYCRKELKNVF